MCAVAQCHAWPPLGNDRMTILDFQCRQPSAWKPESKIYSYCVSITKFVASLLSPSNTMGVNGNPGPAADLSR
jgi:hypothetical protein